MVMDLQRKDQVVDLLDLEELQCQICCCRYSLGRRRPKVLECLHRLCCRCLSRLQDLGGAPVGAVVCPFCRCLTRFPGDVSSLPDDCQLLEVLVLRSRKPRNQRSQRNLQVQAENPELLLSPRLLSSLVSDPRLSSPPSPSSSSSSSSSIRSSSNFVLITILEPPQVPDLQPQQDPLDSLWSRWSVWSCAALLCQTWARALLWVLGLVYLSSLPLGLFLLVQQQTRMGVVLLSLVPLSLLLLTTYGLGRCLCQRLRDCWTSAWTSGWTASLLGS